MKNYEAQICVIAAGPSGLSAAVQAAEDGASVVVLEKAAATWVWGLWALAPDTRKPR